MALFAFDGSLRMLVMLALDFGSQGVGICAKIFSTSRSITSCSNSKPAHGLMPKLTKAHLVFDAAPSWPGCAAR